MERQNAGEEYKLLILFGWYWPFLLEQLLPGILLTWVSIRILNMFIIIDWIAIFWRMIHIYEFFSPEKMENNEEGRCSIAIMAGVLSYKVIQNF